MAVVFLAGALGGIGWMFRDQITPLVQQFLPIGEPSDEDALASAPAESPSPTVSTLPPTPSEPISEMELTPPEPASVSITSTAPSVSSSFDPSEPAPLRAVPATPAEIASISEPPPQPGMTGSVAIPPPTVRPDEGPKTFPTTPPDEKALLEVAPTGPSAAESSAERVLSSQADGPFTKIANLEPEALPAAEALQKFLAAPNVEERLKYTLGAEAMAPLMERYYSRAADGSVIIDTVQIVRYDPQPQVGSGAHAVFGLGSQTWEYPIPVMLEETKEGWKVDWLAFVEFKDRLLEKFLESYQEGAARFHVGISRTHFFDDTVPNADTRHAFRIGPAPPNPFLKTIFLSKDTPLAAKLKDPISWGSQVWAIVELQWRRLGNDQWVELVAVPQLNWYSVPTVQASSAPMPPPSVEEVDESRTATSPLEDIPRAIPTGR